MAELDTAGARATDPWVGTTLLGRYAIEKRIGKGGMGAVYEATHLQLEKKVAIKVLLGDLSDDVTSIDRFRREAIAASRIEHPHIVRVLDLDQAEDGSVFMVMERLVGRDWGAAIAQEGAQPLGRVAHVMEQVLDALEAAHQAGIVHRDLKPENVFLVEQGGDTAFAKVLDFGVSKMLGVRARAMSTATGVALGTPLYMSIEQLKDSKDVDGRADLYAIGVILFRALTGGFPFEAETLPALVAKLLTERAPRVSSRAVIVPAEIDDLVFRLLAHDREERPASAAEVRAVLLPYADVAAPLVKARASVRVASTMALAETAVAPESVRLAKDGGNVRAIVLALALVGLAALGALAVFGGTEPDLADPTPRTTVAEPPPSTSLATTAPDPTTATPPPTETAVAHPPVSGGRPPRSPPVPSSTVAIPDPPPSTVAVIPEPPPSSVTSPPPTTTAADPDLARGFLGDGP